MNKLEALLEVTQRLAALFEQPENERNREQTIDAINQLIEERGQLMQHIHPPFSETEKQTGEKIVDLNNVIKQEMDKLFAELKTEMKQIKQQKRSNQSYVNPYKNVQTMDGMFMDSKK